MSERGALTLEEVREIARRVFREYGVVLDVKVVGSASPGFTWGKIVLPSRVLDLDAEEVEAIIHHEVGHRVFWPGRPDREKLAYAIAVEKRVPMKPELFVNIVADLFVDWELLKRRGEAMLSYVRKLMARTTSKDPLFWFLVLFIRRAAEELGLELDVGKASKLLRAELEELSAMAEESFRIVNSALSDETKLRQLADVLRFRRPSSYDSKPLSMGRMPSWYRLGVPFRVSLNDPIRDPPWLKTRLSSMDPDVIHGMALGGGKVEASEDPLAPPIYIEGPFDRIYLAERGLLLDALKISLISRYLELASGSGGGEELVSSWVPGMPPEELDIELTLMNFGMILPPVFSLARRREDRGGTDIGRVVAVVDVSESMAQGETVVRAKEAAFALIEEARRRGIEAAVVAFNSSVAAWGPGLDYEGLEDVVARLVPSGLTNLSRALEVAAEISRGARTLMVIISDAVLNPSDARRVREMLGGMEGRYLFIWVGEGEVKEFMRGLRVVRVDPGSRMDVLVMSEVARE